VGRRTCVRIGTSRWRGLLARPRTSVTTPLPSDVPPGQILAPGRFDTCRLVAIQLVRAVSRTVTVAVFADGLRAAGPASQDPLPEPAPAIQRCGFADRARGLGTLRRMAPAEPARCAAQVLGLRRGALRRSHPARAAAPPQTGVPRWAGLITLRPPRCPPSGSPAHGVDACRPGSRRGARPRRLSHSQGRRGFCFGSVTVTWDTDSDCDCPTCSPGPTQIADSALTRP
jgi:hypothetical protein